MRGWAGGRAVAIRHMQRQMLCSAAGGKKRGKKIHTPGRCVVRWSAKGLRAIKGMVQQVMGQVVMWRGLFVVEERWHCCYP